MRGITTQSGRWSSHMAGAGMEGTSLTKRREDTGQVSTCSSCRLRRHGEWSAHIGHTPDQFILLTSNCFRVPDVILLVLQDASLRRAISVSLNYGQRHITPHQTTVRKWNEQNFLLVAQTRAFPKSNRPTPQVMSYTCLYNHILTYHLFPILHQSPTIRCP